jgi:branched-chain amino acid transport system substrate-binding protein
MHRSLKQLFLLCILLSYSAILNSFSVEPPHSKPTVKIGAILPLSGNMGQVGEAFRDGIRMAMDEIPADSKFHYEIIFEDDALASAKVALAANKLISVDKVDVIISTWSYGGIVVNPIAERNKVLHFGVAWDPTVAKGNVSFIHLNPPRIFLQTFFKAFARKGWKKFALIGVKESGSVFCFDEFERMAKKAGLEVVYREAVGFDERDFRTLIAKAQEKSPDAYFINMGTPQIELFMKQMNEMKIATPATSITGFDVAQDLKFLEGKWYVSDCYVPGDFEKKFHAQYGPKQIYSVGNYYNIIRLIVYTYEHLPNTTKPPAIELARMIEKEKDFPSIFPSIDIGSDHIISYDASQLIMIKDGQRVPITLDELP